MPAHLAASIVATAMVLAGCASVGDEVACAIDEVTLAETFDIQVDDLEVLSTSGSDIRVLGDSSVSVLQLCGVDDISVLDDLQTDPPTSLDIQQVAVAEETSTLVAVAPPLGADDGGSVRVAGLEGTFRGASPRDCPEWHQVATDLEARRCGVWTELRVLSATPEGDVGPDARLLRDGEVVPTVQRLHPPLTVWAPLRAGVQYALEPGVIDRQTGSRAAAPVIEFDPERVGGGAG